MVNFINMFADTRLELPRGWEIKTDQQGKVSMTATGALHQKVKTHEQVRREVDEIQSLYLRRAIGHQAEGRVTIRIGISVS